MAVAKSTYFNSIRGSISGSTFNNHSGDSFVIFGRKSGNRKPSNVRNRFLSSFSQASSAWLHLSDEWKLNWHSYALSVPAFRSGREAFIASYCVVSNYKRITASTVLAVTDAPVITGICPLYSAEALPSGVNPSSISFQVPNLIRIDEPGPDRDHLYYVYRVSQPLPLGRDGRTSHLRTISEGGSLTGFGTTKTIEVSVPLKFHAYVVSFRFFRRFVGNVLSPIYKIRCISY